MSFGILLYVFFLDTFVKNVYVLKFLVSLSSDFKYLILSSENKFEYGVLNIVFFELFCIFSVAVLLELLVSIKNL